MANPSTGWNQVPVWGMYFKGDDITPDTGSIRLTLTQRVTRTDGRRIYAAGATIERSIGDVNGDPATRDAVRNAWRTADQVKAASSGVSFDGAAWDQWWNQSMAGAVFASFPASDDPDIVQTGYQVKVEERLNSGQGRTYYIQPLLAQLDATPPGINLGLIEVPPGAPLTPAPIYAKGLAGGVAALDVDGDVVNAAGEKIVGGSGSGGASLHNLIPGRSAANAHPISAITDLEARLTAALARANHTGTQTAATISDLVKTVQNTVGAMVTGVGLTPAYDATTGKLTLTVTATGGSGGTGVPDAKAVRDIVAAALRQSGLIGVAYNSAAGSITISTSATANSTDAQLRDRSTHTGVQPIPSVDGLPEALAGKVNASDVTVLTATAVGFGANVFNESIGQWDIKPIYLSEMDPDLTASPPTDPDYVWWNPSGAGSSGTPTGTGIALDADGAPYFLTAAESPGSGLTTDTDGVPYF